MDDRPSSDQPNTSITIMSIWLLTGIILVSAAFFIIPHSQPWISLNAAGGVAGLYLIALLLYVARKPLRLFLRIVVVLIGLIVLGVAAYSWIRSQSYVRQQREDLILLGTTSVRGSLFSGMSVQLLHTLRQFYEAKGKQKPTLSKVLADRFGPVTEGQIIPPPRNAPINDINSYIFRRNRVYLHTLRADTIVFVAIGQDYRGRESGFKNFDGNTGRIQEKMTLTPRGISHESEN